MNAYLPDFFVVVRNKAMEWVFRNFAFREAGNTVEMDMRSTGICPRGQSIETPMSFMPLSIVHLRPFLA